MSSPVVRYSEAFKLHVVGLLESGEASSIAAVSQRFGIRGGTTVSNWVRRYGRNHLLPKVVRVETIDEQDSIRALQKEIKQLKQALGQSYMEALLYQKWFEIACRDGGVADVEAYKKKLAERP